MCVRVCVGGEDRTSRTYWRNTRRISSWVMSVCACGGARVCV